MWRLSSTVFFNCNVTVHSATRSYDQYGLLPGRSKQLEAIRSKRNGLCVTSHANYTTIVQPLRLHRLFLIFAQKQHLYALTSVFVKMLLYEFILFLTMNVGQDNRTTCFQRKTDKIIERTRNAIWKIQFQKCF